MSEKTGFILHYDMLENIKLLGNDAAVEILTALANYDRGLEVGKLSPQAQFAFNAYLPALKKAKRRWEASVKNGCQHEPTSNLAEPSGNLAEPSGNLAQSYSENQEGVLVLVPVLDPVNVSGSGNDLAFPKQPTTTTADIFLNACEKAGFPLDKEKAEKVLSIGIDPSWISGAFTFPQFVAEYVQDAYHGKPQHEKRKLFMSLLAKEDKRNGFPEWRKAKEAEAAAQEERLQQEAAAHEKRRRTGQARACKPEKCKCGDNLEFEGELGTCPACGYRYFFDEKKEGWEHTDPAEFESLAAQFLSRHGQGKTEPLADEQSSTTGSEEPDF